MHACVRHVRVSFNKHSQSPCPLQSLLQQAAKFCEEGRDVWLSSPSTRSATRRNEMIDAIWTIVADLAENSPYAKCMVAAERSLMSGPDVPSSDRIAGGTLPTMPTHCQQELT